MIPDEEKEDCHYLAVAKIIQIILRNNVKIMVICIVWNVVILLERKTADVKTKIFVEL